MGKGVTGSLTIGNIPDVSSRNDKKLNTGSMRRSYNMKKKKLKNSEYKIVNNKYVAGR